MVFFGFCFVATPSELNLLIFYSNPGLGIFCYFVATPELNLLILVAAPELNRFQQPWSWVDIRSTIH